MNEKSREKRHFGHSVECREIDGRKLFVGNAVVYRSLSEPIYGMFREEFLPGAFAEHLRTKPDIVATVDHDFTRLLGRTSSGTLRLMDDDKDLSVEVDRGDTSAARDLAVMIERKDIRGMSFMFDSVDDAWSFDETNKMRVRTVKVARIFEVSFVTFPAYEATDADMRSARALVDAATDPNQRERIFVELALADN